MEGSTPCANCGASVLQAHCPACGQARFDARDRRLGRLAVQFLEALTDLDGRFLRSVRAVLFTPGRLSRDWFIGRRAYWVSPVSLFLLANLLYFLAPGITDFDLPLRDHVRPELAREFEARSEAPPAGGNGGQLHSRFSEPWARARLELEQARLEAAAEREGRLPEPAFDSLARAYGETSAHLSKLLIVLHVPFIALGLMLMMPRSGRYYAEHFVFALHWFTFVLLFIELVMLPGGWLLVKMGAPGGMPTWVKLASAALLFAYGAFAVRRAYERSWPISLLFGAALLMLLLAVNVSVYRALQFAIVFALT